MTLEEWCVQNNKENLLKEWNYNKNTISPAEITFGSAKKVWWRCQLDHEWQAPPYNRTKGSGCPYCSGRIRIKGVNDLATTNPELLSEWNYNKNTISPTEITIGSGKKIWWKCKEGHEWQAPSSSRIKGCGCPYCSGRIRIKGINDLATTNPELLSEWNYDRNTISPTEVSAGSGKKVWWKCQIGHEWKTDVAHRTMGRKCPICAKEAKTSFPEQALLFYIKKYYPDAINTDKDAIGMELDIYIPSLRTAIEYDGKNWHKNNKFELKKNKLCKDNDISLIRIREEGLDLYDDCHCIVRTNVESNSSLSEIIKKILFDIGNISNIDVDIDRDSSLIYDLYITKCKAQNLKNIYPEIAKEWHPRKNGKITPEMISPGSQKKFWWMGSCGHEWQAVVYSRTANRGCPICAGKQVVCGVNDLLTQCPDLCKEWEYERNNEIGIFPDKVPRCSNKKVWWKCKTCGHTWQSKISNRINGRGCPMCNKHHPKKVQCIETGIIYNTSADAAKVVGLKQGDTISLCCQGKNKIAGGYHWKYYNKEIE